LIGWPPSMPSPPPPDAGRTRRRYAPRMASGDRREQLLDAALSVIVQQGYEGVSIEAIARTAGVTRPVIYDHFPNLSCLLQELIAREESLALEQLASVVPDTPPGGGDPAELFAAGVRRFLDAVSERPETWRIILLPPEGTPANVREHVERNRAAVQRRIAAVVEWAVGVSGVPADIDVELSARAIRSLSEEAGRSVLTDPEHFAPERYERFVLTLMRLIWSS